MTGQQLLDATLDGDTEKVRTLLSTQGAQSFINYQDALGDMPAPPPLCRSTSRPKVGMQPSRNSSLQRAVRWISRRRVAVQRCNWLSKRGTTESPR
jgi:hypothetical protein